MVNYQEANCVIGKNKTMFKYIYTVYVYIYKFYNMETKNTT